MANEVRLDIAVTGEQQAKAKLKQVEDAAVKAGDGIEGMGEDADVAAKKSDGLGESLGDATKEAGYLERQIASTTDRLKDLIKQLDATGDTSLVKDIRKGKREVRQLEGFAKELLAPVATGAAEAGTWVGTIIGKSLLDGLKVAAAAASEVVIPLLAGIAIAATPLIGASVAAGVLGGVGAGGIIGGIMAASQDPRVVDAAGGVAERVKDAFAGAAEPFIAPMLKSLSILQTAGTNTARSLAGPFASLAPLLTPLANGLAGLVSNAMPGLTKAFEAAKPVLRVVADELPHIGEALSSFFSATSEGGDGAAIAMAQILNVVQDVIVFVGNLLGDLGQAYEWSVRTGVAVSGVFEDIFGWMPLIGDIFASSNDHFEDLIASLNAGKNPIGDFSGGMTDIGDSTETAAAKVETLKSAIDELFGKTMSLDEANLHYKEGLLSLQEELTSGTRTLNENTEAGQDNVEAILQQIGKIETLRKANADGAMGLEGANKVYDAHLEQLRKNLLSLGYNAAAVQVLIDKYKNIPKNVTTQLSVSYTGGFSTGGNAAFSQRASGGPVKPGQPYLVGEQGPELVTFGENGTVHTASDTAAMMSGASGGSMGGAAAGGGGTQVTIGLAPGGDQALLSMLVGMLQIYVQGHGGNVQDALGWDR